MENPITNIAYSLQPGEGGEKTEIHNRDPNSPEVMPVKRGRGRPSLGKPVPVVMNDEERAVAKSLGDGNIAAGVRSALRIIGAIGPEEALRLAELQTTVQEARQAGHEIPSVEPAGGDPAAAGGEVPA